MNSEFVQSGIWEKGAGRVEGVTVKEGNLFTVKSNEDSLGYRLYNGTIGCQMDDAKLELGQKVGKRDILSRPARL